MIDRNAVRHIFGTEVCGPDGGKIGSAGQVYLDNATGEPAWVAVRTGLFGRKESFVPLGEATFTDGRLVVPFDKDRVRRAPAMDPDGELSPDDEEELHRHYSTAGSDAMTRSEERLVVKDTRTEETGKARLRKYVVTEERQVTVPVSREEVRLEEEPAATGPTGSGPTGSGGPREDDHEMTLWAEKPVVTTETVPVERVRLGKKTVTEPETVTGDVRKERIELTDDGHPDQR